MPEFKIYCSSIDHQVGQTPGQTLGNAQQNSSAFIIQTDGSEYVDLHHSHLYHPDPKIQFCQIKIPKHFFRFFFCLVGSCEKKTSPPPPFFFGIMLLLQVLHLWLGRSGRSGQPSSSELNRVVSKVWVGNLRIHQKSRTPWWDDTHLSSQGVEWNRSDFF